MTLLGVAASVPAVLLYSRTRGRLDRRDRLVLSALRVGALGMVAFCLLRPMLVIATVVPQENFLGVLLDDSLNDFHKSGLLFEATLTMLAAIAFLRTPEPDPRAV